MNSVLHRRAHRSVGPDAPLLPSLLATCMCIVLWPSPLHALCNTSRHAYHRARSAAFPGPINWFVRYESHPMPTMMSSPPHVESARSTPRRHLISILSQSSSGSATADTGNDSQAPSPHHQNYHKRATCARARAHTLMLKASVPNRQPERSTPSGRA